MQYRGPKFLLRQVKIKLVEAKAENCFDDIPARAGSFQESRKDQPSPWLSWSSPLAHEFNCCQNSKVVLKTEDWRTATKILHDCKCVFQKYKNQS
jgi:hypothetical protein